MSPQLTAEERLRRLAPLAVAAAAFALALTPGAAVPSRRQLAAGGLIALAGALVAHAVAGRGASGAIGGAVAGLWLAAAAITTGAATDLPAAAGLAAAATVAAFLARADAGPERAATPPPLATAPAAVALMILAPAAWALGAAAAALVAVRDRGRRRWLAVAPALAAAAGAMLTSLAALGRAPSWAPTRSRLAVDPWLSAVIDHLGPVAIVAAAIGIGIVAADRRSRWLAAAVAGALASLAPLTTATPTAALVGVSVALGITVAAAGARVGRPRYQLLAAATLAALLVVPVATVLAW